jgi:Tfp pilus assembly PilM family ATPase
MSGFFLSLRDARGPAAAIEIASHRVSAARVERRGGRAIVTAHASEPLAEGQLVPSLTQTNVHDRAGVAGVVARVLAQVGTPRRVGLVVPDPIAKVSLLTFQDVPARPQDLDQLIRWQIKKASPFPLEEAQVAYEPGASTTEGQTYVVSAARRDIVQEYESLCADAGAHAGLVDLSTFHVVNAVLAGQGQAPADSLLVNLAPDWVSLTILRGGQVIFFRSRSADGDGTLADLIHQTAMYNEDRLHGTGFGQVLVCGTSLSGRQPAFDLDALTGSLEERLHASVHAIDPRLAMPFLDDTHASWGAFDAWTPVVGLLARAGGAAA